MDEVIRIKERTFVSAIEQIQKAQGILADINIKDQEFDYVRKKCYSQLDDVVSEIRSTINKINYNYQQ